MQSPKSRTRVIHYDIKSAFRELYGRETCKAKYDLADAMANGKKFAWSDKVVEWKLRIMNEQLEKMTKEEKAELRVMWFNARDRYWEKKKGLV
jgi:hypothetical protein